MICKNPFIASGGAVFGCGSCLPCRFNQRRVLTARLLLEAKQYEHTAFVTLTYNDDNLPADGSLDKKATRYWLDRLRKSVGYGSFRFYLVGEYGDLSLRPHYHVALFGYGSCEYGQTRVNAKGEPRSDCCVSCSLIHHTWGKGHVFLGELSEDSAQYICGYVTKKLARSNVERLNGRAPEFSSSSKQGVGGIGAGAAAEIASTLLTFNLDRTQADVPSALRFGSRLLPLGRYMKRKIREQVGRDVSTPKTVQLERSAQMRPLLVRQKTNADSSLKKEVINKFGGKVALSLHRQKLLQKDKKL